MSITSILRDVKNIFDVVKSTEGEADAEPDLLDVLSSECFCVLKNTHINIEYLYKH